MSRWLQVAKALNRLGVPYPYLNRISCGSTSILTEIKIEVTDRCNLACTFCHQDFGAKNGTTTLDMANYDRILEAAKNERIPVVRLTGGEPLVLGPDPPVLLRKRLWLRTVVAFNNDNIGDSVRLSHLDIRLIFGRAIAGDRCGVIGKFNHDVARPAGAFGGFELARANQKTSAKFLEDCGIGSCVEFVAFVIRHVDTRDPITFGHFQSLDGCGP